MTQRTGGVTPPSGPFQSRFHAQKMTPNATATIEAITMSIVRHRLTVVVAMSLSPSFRYREETHAVNYRGAAGEKTELPALALPRSGTRVCGSPRTLSAVRSPVG